MDPVSIFSLLSALVPSLGYAFKRIVDYKTGGAAPSNAQDAALQGETEVKKMQALAALDNAEGAAQWVINIRALQRPVVVFITLLVWSLVTLKIVNVDLQMYVITANIASSVMFYLFGDRTLMYSIQSFNKKLTGT